MQILLNDEQQVTALASIRVSVDTDSNVNSESEVHPKKHSLLRTSTNAGMQIEHRDEHEQNAFRSICFNRHPGANVNEQNCLE
jgi:hypothetical protein